MLKDLPPEKLEEFDSKYGGDWQGIEARSTWLAFRKPTRDEHTRAVDRLSMGATATAARRELALACLIYPDQAGFVEAIDIEPALLLAEISPMLDQLAGEGKERRRLKPKAPSGS